MQSYKINPSVSASPTRSFQNEPLPKKRQSVDRLILADVSNEQPAKRQCSSRVSITQNLQAKASEVILVRAAKYDRGR